MWMNYNLHFFNLLGINITNKSDFMPYFYMLIAV